MDLMTQINSLPIYAVCATIVILVMGMCIIFAIKSYRMGLKIGMDQAILKRVIVSSITFTIIPSIGILLGVIALSGTLGIPLSWMRLSIIGSLHYETSVAEMAATSSGMSGLVASELTASAYTSIVMIMGLGVVWGAVLSVIALKKYLSTFNKKPKVTENLSTTTPSFGDTAMISMFAGMCSAYLCSYIGLAVHSTLYMPLIVSSISALTMGIFTYLKEKKNFIWLDNFSLAGSMLTGMASAVLVHLLTGGLIV